MFLSEVFLFYIVQLFAKFSINLKSAEFGPALELWYGEWRPAVNALQIFCGCSRKLLNLSWRPQSGNTNTKDCGWKQARNNWNSASMWAKSSMAGRGAIAAISIGIELLLAAYKTRTLGKGKIKIGNNRGYSTRGHATTAWFNVLIIIFSFVHHFLVSVIKICHQKSLFKICHQISIFKICHQKSLFKMCHQKSIFRCEASL